MKSSSSAIDHTTARPVSSSTAPASQITPTPAFQTASTDSRIRRRLPATFTSAMTASRSAT
jgi:hypothetical protein